MSEAGFASLGPTLLARKGGAKPAMRPQLAPLPEIVAAEQLEDLGWNDMGNDDAPAATDVPNEAVAEAADHSDPVSQRAALPQLTALSDDPVKDSDAHANVLALPSAITNADQAEAAPLLKSKDAKPISPAPSPAKNRLAKKSKAQAKSAKGAKSGGAERRAAFTLRLDAQRHLKLRLAATMQGVSAQALVTEALDAMLSQFEELDALASRMRPH